MRRLANSERRFSRTTGSSVQVASSILSPCQGRSPGAPGMRFASNSAKPARDNLVVRPKMPVLLSGRGLADAKKNDARQNAEASAQSVGRRQPPADSAAPEPGRRRTAGTVQSHGG